MASSSSSNHSFLLLLLFPLLLVLLLSTTVADLCLHFAANKTKEAKGAADTLLAAEKGKPASGCLKACATNIKSMAEVLVNLPAGQDDMNAYQPIRRSEPSSKTRNHSLREGLLEQDVIVVIFSRDIVDKFHDIWNVAKVGNMQINYIFPWPDSDDDDNIL
ncbi:hypothetical protein BDA96_05G000500 [Sorghum bicolor]|uniref:Pectinesterase inhibitor domain-containing protein n=1 Tax=Sorghum bicolor TaxID=4558 RepID=A0A921UEQ1_SORBI|nr:hypothetical protein BDA96_05G000500 [Sorghum bicolor]